MKKKKEPPQDPDYCIDAVCHVCSKPFKARYTLGRDRARTCTSPDHVCQRKTLQIPGRKDKLIVCVEKCCRSQWTKGSASSMITAEIDSRKFLNDEEYRKTLKKTYEVEALYGIAIRFTLETGARCGETLLVRKRNIEIRPGPISIIRMPTLKKAGHPLLPVDLDNSGTLAKELLVWIKKLDADELLFPIAKRTFQHVFEKILDKVKPDRAGLVHIMRHTRASRLIAAGFDFNYVRKQLRWSSLELAKIYVHTEQEKVVGLMGKLR
jgi:integrase